MNYVLNGIETLLRNNTQITRFVHADDIHVWSDINLVPSGSSWPYIVIKDSDSPTNFLMGQTEEFLNVKIYVCHKSYKKRGAAELLASPNDGTVMWLVKQIKDVLAADMDRQFALEGFYLGDTPIQCLGVEDEPESEPFTPRGVTVTTEWSTSRKRINAHYYRYSVREVAV